MKKYFGDKGDSNFFGQLLMLIGSFLLSLVIIDWVKLFMKNIYWVNYLIIFGFGYLIYSFGFFIYKRDKKETIHSIKNLLLIIGMILILCLIIIFNFSLH